MDSEEMVFLQRAVELASNGRGFVSPNPLVGAVVVRDGQVIGEGWHRQLGGAHAEVEAIADAGGPNLTAGATLYVSLEPCCHEGRTAPCTDAIVEAGISKVVVASDDPSEKASGRGLGILRDEGIDVSVPRTEAGVLARSINQPFRKHAQSGRPWVLAKTAMSLDGKVATSTGDSKWISSEESRSLVHGWRGEVDAVAVGIGTALADDPLLTARQVAASTQPRRVVFDSSARLPLDSRLLASIDEAPITLVTGRGADRGQVNALEASGVEVIVATGENEAARVESAMDQLGAAGITSIMVEGGPVLCGAFLDAGEIDELRVFIAPVLIGSRTARDPFEGAGREMIDDAIRVPDPSWEMVGGDLLVKSRLREW